MTTYNVHINREVALVFEGIDADSHEEAAAIACDKHPAAADDIDHGDGETFSAQVDVAGDEGSSPPVTIAFEPERQRKAAPKLFAACRMVVDRWERGDLAEAARACSTAVAEAGSTGILPEKGDDDVNRRHGNAQGMAKVLGGARRLILDMGRIIRGLDENNEWLEFWTNDGEYLCCDSRYDDIVAALAHAVAAEPPGAGDPAKKPYSVLLLYPDDVNDGGSETYYAWVEAPDPTAAVADARRQALATNEWTDRDPADFLPLLVIEGHHYGQPMSDD